ncbi:type II toxin-antitoxin system HipA family toxin [Mobilicoccus pelagius]|uniref:HipA-like C-terminal domain-containing protein n=1 Tax=Mobilicoccus pelagius NBRC 104925 TaxID=1089455 RepID=H5US09_9MICO|nr:HipA domain-containing protein [Mobilicoccus pelagius]GAB48517.1 hypothetical protein MOPEL_074_00040 [Mobilicoccus pelagius NBRC 104925]
MVTRTSSGAASDVLDVVLYGTHVAEVRRGREPHRLDWTWTADAAARWGVGARVVGHAAPVGEPGARLHDLRAGVVVAGLLPEGQARLHYAVNAGIDPDDTFAMLRRYGRDTAGALDFVPRTGRPGDPAAEPVPLGDAQVRELLERAGSSRRDGGLTSISLAGLVPKIALRRAADGSWWQPPPGIPSTWILKVAHPVGSDAADVVDTEAACLDLGRRVGVTTVQAEVIEVDGLRAIAVSRYDRMPDGRSGVARLHQEDLAQALGLNTADPARKFQRGRTIPSWRAASDVIRAGRGRLSPLARLVAFSWLVGNSDHHAKNTSFLRHADGRVDVAPAYDVAAHLHHPGAHRTALDLAGESDFDALTVAHVVDEVASWGVPGDAARAAVVDVVTDLTDALARIDRGRHPGVTPGAWTVLDDRVARAAGELGLRS